VDNRRLEEFREKANMFFMDPSQKDEEIPWGIALIDREKREHIYDNYRYAIDINDENLAELAAILEDSIKFNRTVTVFVVILSVISGFLVGFLMIRRRKRDILLMRMVGESNARVYAGFALEQMICILIGIAIGGAYYKWNPINNLAIFAVAYFIALSLALVIFMSKKLINNVKEDE
jgi:ABC-type antimicrobial peptide transport system permease subunit